MPATLGRIDEADDFREAVIKAHDRTGGCSQTAALSYALGRNTSASLSPASSTAATNAAAASSSAPPSATVSAPCN